MNRLTKDLNTPHDDTTYTDVVKDCIDRENIVLTKLKHYEGIEEELGIDLITLFKALKDGIYYAHIDDYVLPELYYDEEAMNSDDEADGWTFKVTYFDEIYKIRRVEILSVKYDYKVVWALHKSDIK